MALTITTASLPGGTTGTAYSATLAAAGGTGGTGIFTLTGLYGTRPVTVIIATIAGGTAALDAVGVPADSSGTSIAASGVTLANSGDWLLWFAGNENTWGGAGYAITPPAGFTAQATNGAAAVNATAMLADNQSAAAGATGTVTGTSASATGSMSVMVAVAASGTGFSGSPSTGVTVTPSCTGTPRIPSVGAPSTGISVTPSAAGEAGGVQPGGMYVFEGGQWVKQQFSGAQLITAQTILGQQIAAQTITAAQIAAGTITAGQIAADTITGANIAANTVTATELAAGIVYGTIVDGTVITGSTLQNSSGNPRTSINPDGSVSITNSAGTVIFKIGPDGTIFWFNSVGVLMMQLQPGGTTLIYGSATGPVTWDFEGPSTNSWTGTNAVLAGDSAWSSTGTGSLKVTHSGTSQPWGATSPAFPVTQNTLASMTCVLHVPSATVTGVTIGFTFFAGAGGSGANLGSVAGDQGTFSVTSAADVVATITGATVPATAQSAVFFVQSALATASVALNIDSVSVAGGLVYSLSPVAGTDGLGNPFDQGATFTGLPGLTNVLSVKDPYGNKLAGIDSTGNVSGQVINAVTDLQVGGVSVAGSIGSQAQGIINRGWTPSGGWPSTAIGATETAVLELDTTIPANRRAIIKVFPSDFLMTTAPSSSTQYVQRLKFTTDGSTPTTASTEVAGHSPAIVELDTSAHNNMSPYMEWIPAISGSDVTYRILITADVQSGAFKYQNVLEARWEDLGLDGGQYGNSGVAFGTGTSGGSGGLQTHTEFFYPLNTYSYYSGSGLRDHNGSLYHGAYSGESDYQYSYIQWATGSLGNSVTTVLGYTVNSVSLRLTNLHSWYNNGMTWGLHTSPSGGLGGGVGTYSVLLGGFFISEGNTFDYSLGSSQYSGLGGGNWTVLGPDAGDEHNLNWYGFFYGKGSTSQMPRLTVNYTH